MKGKKDERERRGRTEGVRERVKKEKRNRRKERGRNGKGLKRGEGEKR
ncbi:hypothetical protein [Streptococcus dysgalactiae]|nr:hypothetical protein [Streptococcus dysgalactiae]